MAELETGVLPPLDEPTVNGSGFGGEMGEDIEAPYGRKADGTPRKKPGRPPGSGGGSGSGTRTGGDTVLGKRIADELVELSAPIGLVSPLTMVHVETRADRTGMALVAISKKYPRVKHAIDAYFNSVAYKDIAFFVGGIPVAIMMDYGMLKPDSKVGVPWGMEKLWQECYGENGTETAPDRVAPRGLAAEL